MNEEVRKRFQYHQPADDMTRDAHSSVRGVHLDAVVQIDHLCPESREKSLALTALQEAMMWANAAIAIHGVSNEYRESYEEVEPESSVEALERLRENAGWGQSPEELEVELDNPQRAFAIAPDPKLRLSAISLVHGQGEKITGDAIDFLIEMAKKGVSA